jgi:hypothetical protein
MIRMIRFVTIELACFASVPVFHIQEQVQRT